MKRRGFNERCRRKRRRESERRCLQQQPKQRGEGKRKLQKLKDKRKHRLLR